MNDSVNNVPCKSQDVDGAVIIPNSRGLVVSALAKMPQGTVLDERALASTLDVSPRTVRRMVDRCELPAGVKLGSRKIWLSDKVLAYFAERADKAAREAKRQAARLRGDS